MNSLLDQQNTMDQIDVTPNRNKTLTISKRNNKSITLSRNAISTLKQHKNSILFDFKIGDGKEKVYWKNVNAKIFTKRMDSCNGSSEKTKLWISKNGNTIDLDKDSFVGVLSKSLSAIEKGRYSSFKPDEYYDLTVQKKIILESKENTFTILISNMEEEFSHDITFPLDALEVIVKKKKEIFADLQGNNGTKVIEYWSRNGCSIYTGQYRNSRMLFFEPSFPKGTCITDNTLQKLVDVLGDFFGEEELPDDDLSEDESEKFGKEIRINDAKTIQFSLNKKEFIITNKGDRKREVQLPISVLDILEDNKSRILTDLNSEAMPLGGLNYINEYWRNESHAVRTATLRETEKILRFDGLRRKEFIISMKEHAFLALLDIYKQHKYK